MPRWGVAMATGPYVNMDGEPTYQMKTSCAAVEEGHKRKPADAREAAHLDAAPAMPNCTLRDPGRGRWPPWLSAWVVSPGTLRQAGSVTRLRAYWQTGTGPTGDV